MICTFSTFHCFSTRYNTHRIHVCYGNIYHQYTPNVSIYTIHGSYGIWGYQTHIPKVLLVTPVSTPPLSCWWSRHVLQTMATRIYYGLFRPEVTVSALVLRKFEKKRYTWMVMIRMVKDVIYDMLSCKFTICLSLLSPLQHWSIPSGELTFCHGKIHPFFMGKSTINDINGHFP